MTYKDKGTYESSPPCTKTVCSTCLVHMCDMTHHPRRIFCTICIIDTSLSYINMHTNMHTGYIRINMYTYVCIRIRIYSYTYVCIPSWIRMRAILTICMSAKVTEWRRRLMDESCNPYEWVMSRIWMRHAYEWVTSHTQYFEWACIDWALLFYPAHLVWCVSLCLYVYVRVCVRMSMSMCVLMSVSTSPPFLPSISCVVSVSISVCVCESACAYVCVYEPSFPAQHNLCGMCLYFCVWERECVLMSVSMSPPFLPSITSVVCVSMSMCVCESVYIYVCANVCVYKPSFSAHHVLCGMCLYFCVYMWECVCLCLCLCALPFYSTSHVCVIYRSLLQKSPVKETICCKRDL